MGKRGDVVRQRGGQKDLIARAGLATGAPFVLGGLLDGLFGLGGDGVRGVGGLIDLVGDALHAIFEAAETFAETFAELGQLLAAEKNHHDRQDQQKMRGLKKSVHGAPRGPPPSRAAGR